MTYTELMRNQPQNYTIGTINKIWKPVKGGKQVSFKYSVNGTEYYGNVDYFGYELIAKPGKRFLVNFNKDYAWDGFMNLNIPVPNGSNAPIDGWEEHPIF